LKPKTKEIIEKQKKLFAVAVRDKKRWITCGIELAIVVALIVADLLTKRYIWGYCDTHGRSLRFIPGFMRFTAARNTGAAFGMFSSSVLALAVVSLICTIGLIAFIFYSYPRRNLTFRTALIFITAGAFGNNVDRFALRYVRDFIEFEFMNYAIFNFADACLTVGTILLLVYLVCNYSSDEKAKLEKAKQEEEAKKAEETAEEVKEENLTSNE